MYNIIADIAGRYNELMKLVELMPKDNKIILVGDLVDRGPDSRKVVEWAMNTPNVITIKGNHEDMMIEAYEIKLSGLDHHYNGGQATMKSYGVSSPSEYPEEHIAWMKNLPVFIMEKGLFVSHAPWIREHELGEIYSEFYTLWNRCYPGYHEGVYQIHGHNTLSQIYINDVGVDYARCIDNSGNKVLTGFSWPERHVYEVEYE